MVPQYIFGQLLERAIADALFWLLIIFGIAKAMIWMFKTSINYFLVEDVKVPKKKSEEEGE